MTIKNSWWSCDEQRKWEASVSRRSVLLGAGFSLAMWTGARSALADLTVATQARDRPHDVLVYVFLRGGADGLNIVAPYAEDAYYRRRPNLSIAAPKDARTKPEARLLDLDGFFGLHPALAPLLPSYREGQMAILHAVGSQDGTRSHFEAMAAVERGLAFEGPGPSSGWIARHLSSTEKQADSPLRAVAFGGTMPDSLRGASNTVALESITDFKLETDDDRRAHLERSLLSLYSEGRDEVAHAGQETIKVLDALRKIDPNQYKPSNGATYPATDLGSGFRQTACLIRAKLGLEVACLDRTGWDTHFAQGSTVGILALSLDDLGKSLSAFVRDLGREMAGVTVVVMTEFGRRLAENSSLGTDHGRASAMFVLGGGAAGGQVYRRWPGIEDYQLDETGDLRVTTDYRDVLAEVLRNRLGSDRLDTIFQGYAPKPVGIVKAAL
ncbi:MAG: DUF1501 domain-containing protein [Fimbriimonas sp.]|nr:DUF1501 domain-containing protein [Fimbriimonas sp.]